MKGATHEVGLEHTDPSFSADEEEAPRAEGIGKTAGVHRDSMHGSSNRVLETSGKSTKATEQFKKGPSGLRDPHSGEDPHSGVGAAQPGGGQADSAKSAPESTRHEGDGSKSVGNTEKIRSLELSSSESSSLSNSSFQSSVTAGMVSSVSGLSSSKETHSNYTRSSARTSFGWNKLESDAESSTHASVHGDKRTLDSPTKSSPTKDTFGRQTDSDKTDHIDGLQERIEASPAVQKLRKDKQQEAQGSKGQGNDEPESAGASSARSRRRRKPLSLQARIAKQLVEKEERLSIGQVVAKRAQKFLPVTVFTQEVIAGQIERITQITKT